MTNKRWEEMQEATEGTMDRLLRDSWMKGHAERVVSETDDDTRAAEAMREMVTEVAERQEWNLVMEDVDWNRVVSWARKTA